MSSSTAGEPETALPDRALVLGGSGHLGNAITRELLDRGVRVTAVGRHRRPVNLLGLDVDYRRGDLDRHGRLAEWVDGHGWVIDAAAPYPVHRFAGRAELPAAALAESRVDALIEAVDRRGARLVHLGSFLTTARWTGRWRRLESSWLRRLHPYFELKRRIETRVLRARQRGVRSLVVRPTTCLGPWDLKPGDLSIIVRTLTGRLPALLDSAINVIDVRDVARGVVEAGREPSLSELSLVGHNVPLAVLVRWAAEIGGVEPPRRTLPTRLGIFAALAQEAWLAPRGRRASIPMLGPLLIHESPMMSPSVAQGRLGIFPRPLSETLDATIRWYRSIEYC